ISDHGSIDWLCLPRPDSPPDFRRILDPERAYFSVSSPAPEIVATTQRYLPNTNILVTTVSLPNGDSFQITDFCPRFEQYGRIYRPAALFRMVEPLSGTPSIYPHLLSAHLRLEKGAVPIDPAAAATCDTTFVGSPYACSPNMSLTYL